MRFLRRFFIRLSNFTAGRRADQRFREEIAEHVALQTEENLRAGMPLVEARRQAALKLGAAQAIREQHHAEQGLPLAENFLFDLRYAFRMLHRSPGFSLVVIATMALGIGASTAIYSVIDATLLHPLPYPNPSELVRIEDDLRVWAHRMLTFRFLSGRTWRTRGFFSSWPSTFSAPRILRAAHSPRVSWRRW